MICVRMGDGGSEKSSCLAIVVVVLVGFVVVVVIVVGFGNVVVFLFVCFFNVTASLVRVLWCEISSVRSLFFLFVFCIDSCCFVVRVYCVAVVFFSLWRGYCC